MVYRSRQLDDDGIHWANLTVIKQSGTTLLVHKDYRRAITRVTAAAACETSQTHRAVKDVVALSLSKTSQSAMAKSEETAIWWKEEEWEFTRGLCFS